MAEYKLQAGCLVIVLFVAIIYYRQQFKYKLKNRFSLFDLMIITGIFSLVMDGLTAYTVNHADTVSHTFNLVLHALFLISLDSVVFVLFLYTLSTTGYFPKKIKTKIAIFLPFIVNIFLVLFGIGSLKFISGNASSYSMGLSAYTCFAMVAIYTLMTFFVFIKRWDRIEKNNRTCVIVYLAIQISVTLFQIIVPDSLISSIATTTLILAVYLNQEDPAIEELSRYHNEMVMGFATLIENRDASTGAHVRRTTAYVKLLAEGLVNRGCYTKTLTTEYLNNLYLAAPLHDIGKIAIPDAILQNPGRLTPEEFDQIKTHTVRGGQIIKETFGKVGNAEYLKVAYDVARFHHEKWNGTGYPDGLSGTDIPLCARIMSIADVFDAVSENRCYRAAMPLDKCFAIIKDGSGKDFEALLVDVFLSLREKVEQAHKSCN